MSAPVVTPLVVIPPVADGAGPTVPYVGFAAGTQITCKINGMEQAVAVEELKPGMLVRTRFNGFCAVDKVGQRTLVNPSSQDRLANRLYVLPKANYPSLTADLTITGNRSVLIPVANDAQKRQMIAVHGRICIADRQYCLPCAADANATLDPVQGDVVIYNFSLESSNRVVNQGVFANGLLVDNSSSVHMMNKAYTLVQ